MEYIMTKNSSGFTIVEVTIVVAIIAILAAISVVMYSQVQIDGRNSERSSKVEIITGALEKYYSQKGEYPGCNAMKQAGNLVSANVLVGIDTNALLVPGSAAGVTNSITCTALTGSSPDAYAYVGDGSAACSSGNACLKYTLQYRKEGSGDIVTKQSLHTTTLGGSSVPTLTAQSINATQVNISWTGVNGALQYRYERSTNTDFTANVVQTTTSGVSASVTGLTNGTTYYFRVLAIASGSESNWSNVASAGVLTAPPQSTPTTTADVSGSDAIGTASVVTCSAGTVQYQMRTRNTSTAVDGAWTAWSAWATSRTLTVAASQGYQYSFQAKARCLVGSAGSGATAESNIAVVVRPIDTPAAPIALTPASFDSPDGAAVTFSGVCPDGTTRSDATFRTHAWTGEHFGPSAWGSIDTWENNTGSNKNVEYWGKYKCKTTHYTSASSPESYRVVIVTP